MAENRHTTEIAVDCAVIRQGFMTGEALSGASVDEHLKVCEQCGDLFANGATLGHRLASLTPRASADLHAQLVETEALLEHEHGLHAYLRSRPTRVRWALSVGLPALLLARELLQRRG